MSKATEPVTIACNGKSVTFDAQMNNAEDYVSTVPAFPTEKGFKISDTVIVEPPTLEMTLYLSNRPLTWKDRNGIGNVEANTALLENLYFERDACVVSTSDKVYKNMAITALKIQKTELSGGDKTVSVIFKQIAITQQQTVSIDNSYGKAGVTMATTGMAKTIEGSTGTKEVAESTNALYNAAVAAGFVA